MANGDIEDALRGCSGVKDAAVLDRVDGARHSAFVELDAGVKGLLPRHLMSMLARRLPGVALPSVIVVLPSLPRRPDLSVDRLALQQIAPVDDTLDRAGGDALLAAVMQTFEDVIGVTGATPEDDLTSLGGDSLHAVEVAMELEARLGVAVTPEAFEQCPTLRHLSAWIGKRRPAGV